MSILQLDEGTSTLTLKNRSLKVSPGGIITLPVSARKTLKMQPGEGRRVAVAIEGDKIAITPVIGHGGFRISAKGMMELQGEPRAILESGTNRHYWLELIDENEVVFLHPYK